MSLPGFTAETSVYKTNKHYRMSGYFNKTYEAINPAHAPSIEGLARLAYECTPSGSACVCSGVFDCLLMGKDGKCAGKAAGCSGERCACW